MFSFWSRTLTTRFFLVFGASRIVSTLPQTGVLTGRLVYSTSLKDLDPFAPPPNCFQLVLLRTGLISISSPHRGCELYIQRG